jgi:hypothetical protein
LAVYHEPTIDHPGDRSISQRRNPVENGNANSALMRSLPIAGGCRSSVRLTGAR